ncbi:SDR family oxidoreductase [Dyella flava]|uniref:SDR family oxidoreductase n=1 Tax=Dyella flava TaxID=1920170 RepID=UPI0024E05C0C|nr:SDR family oxidoreductase [Dyella flava]
MSPGTADTPLYDKLNIADAYRDQVNQQIIDSIPYGRFGKPDGVAKAVVHLASDESAWTVSAEMVVDGRRRLNG